VAVTMDSLAAEDASFAKAAASKQEQDHPSSDILPTSVFHWMNNGPVGRATLSALDGAVSTADAIYDSQPMKKARDVVSGAVTGATNIASAAGSFNDALQRNVNAKERVEREEGLTSAPERSPEDLREAAFSGNSEIWDHAKSSILDFRDAAAVQDPTLSDNLIQGVAQLALPFAGYSRMLGGLHWAANAVAAGALTDATALGPHDSRMADLIALGRHTEGKLGSALRTLAPDGSAFNAYINFLGDRTNESEAEGRFKNVLDGFGSNLIATPLLHAVGVTLKQGTAGLRYLVDNGVGSAGSLVPAGSRATQEGKIVFHGTPHDFDEFDTSKIGTGEGNQSFGHGLYFAEDATTAGTYQKKLTFRGQPDLAAAAQNLATFDGNRPKAYMDLMLKAEKASDPNIAAKFRRQADFIKSGAAEKSGNLMHVDIPDEVIGSMLDHDAPMSEQQHILDKIPKHDREQLETLLEDHNQGGELESYSGNQFHQIVKRAMNEDYLIPPTDSVDPPQMAAAYLDHLGIPGIKYFDRGSRGAGSGTRNIVLFDAKHAKIVKKE